LNRQRSPTRLIQYLLSFSGRQPFSLFLLHPPSGLFDSLPDLNVVEFLPPPILRLLEKVGKPL